MAFSASLPPAPAAAPCILIWQGCCANPLELPRVPGEDFRAGLHPSGRCQSAQHRTASWQLPKPKLFPRYVHPDCLFLLHKPLSKGKYTGTNFPWETLHHPLHSHPNTNQIRIRFNLKLHSRSSTTKPSKALHPPGSRRSLTPKGEVFLGLSLLCPTVPMDESSF